MKKDELKKEIEVVINVIEENYAVNQSIGVLVLNYKRYKNALELIENNKVSKETLNILGGTKAYLDSYSDYNNPLLNKMNIVEKMVKEFYY